jgi:glucosamine-6-phosphate deaminase
MHAMRIFQFETGDEAARALAQRVAEAIRARPTLTIGLPAGRTMIPVYAHLRRLRTRTALNTSQVVSFAVDEFIGLSHADAGSYRHFLDDHLLAAFGIPPSQTHFPDGATHDPEGESRRYEDAIAEAGGIDLQLLGLGVNGHIGFNEPGDTLQANTHVVTLHEETREANATWFGGEVARVPRQALSMGMATVLRAREVALIATGHAKAGAVVRAVEGKITTRVPASLLQLHRDVQIYLDREASSLMTR